MVKIYVKKRILLVVFVSLVIGAICSEIMQAPFSEFSLRKQLTNDEPTGAENWTKKNFQFDKIKSVPIDYQDGHPYGLTTYEDKFCFVTLHGNLNSCIRIFSQKGELVECLTLPSPLSELSFPGIYYQHIMSNKVLSYCNGYYLTNHTELCYYNMTNREMRCIWTPENQSNSAGEILNPHFSSDLAPVNRSIWFRSEGGTQMNKIYSIDTKTHSI